MTARYRKTEIVLQELQLTKPASSDHPYVSESTEAGPWDNAAVSMSQGGEDGPAMQHENRPPTLLSRDGRREVAETRRKQNTQMGQTMAAIKGMCQRGRTCGALNLLPPHIQAIWSLIQAGALEPIEGYPDWGTS